MSISKFLIHLTKRTNAHLSRTHIERGVRDGWNELLDIFRRRFFCITADRTHPPKSSNFWMTLTPVLSAVDITDCFAMWKCCFVLRTEQIKEVFFSLKEHYIKTAYCHDMADHAVIQNTNHCRAQNCPCMRHCDLFSHCSKPWIAPERTDQ